MKTTFRLLVAYLLCALACGGCVRSERPLSAVSESKADPRLAGMWRIVEGDDEHQDEVVRVTFKEGVGQLELFKQDRTWEPVSRIQGFSITRTAKASYLNVFGYDDDQTKPDASKAQHFFFLKYQISDDGEDLTYWQMKTSYFLQAVQAGKLKGEKRDGGLPVETDSIYLKDTSEAILRFVDALPDDAFGQPVKAVKLTIKVK